MTPVGTVENSLFLVGKFGAYPHSAVNKDRGRDPYLGDSRERREMFCTLCCPLSVIALVPFIPSFAVKRLWADA